MYVKIFILNKLFVFPVIRSQFECFRKSGFYLKILSCAATHFFEIRSKVKNHHISEAGVSFEIQFGLFIKIPAEEHIL